MEVVHRLRSCQYNSWHGSYNDNLVERLMWVAGFEEQSPTRQQGIAEEGEYSEHMAH